MRGFFVHINVKTFNVIPFVESYQYKKQKKSERRFKTVMFVTAETDEVNATTAQSEYWTYDSICCHKKNCLWLTLQFYFEAA